LIWWYDERKCYTTTHHGAGLVDDESSVEVGAVVVVFVVVGDVGATDVNPSVEVDGVIVDVFESLVDVVGAAATGVATGASRGLINNAVALAHTSLPLPASRRALINNFRPSFLVAYSFTSK
jgi:hypothetical protein